MKRTIALLFLVATGWPSAASAQRRPEPPPTVITLRPASEPIPALKYRLVPERRDLVPGNAAVFYHRGILMLKQFQSGLKAKEKAQPGANHDPNAGLSIEDRTYATIGEIPRDEARQYLQSVHNVLNEVELGALQTTCDWEFDQRKEGMTLLLPEIQEMRGLARLVMLKAQAVHPRRQDRRSHALDRERPRHGPARQRGSVRDPGPRRHRD